MRVQPEIQQLVFAHAFESRRRSFMLKCVGKGFAVRVLVVHSRLDFWLSVIVSSPEDLLALRWLQSKPSHMRRLLFRFFLFVWIPGFPVPVESSRSADVPLTMTMLSLWPWHHSRLWIINRGPDGSAGGLFVGKQGAISLSRQAGLMAGHKYIKKGGSVAISSDLHSGHFAPALNSHLGAQLFFSPTLKKKKYSFFAEVLWKFLLRPHDSGSTNGSIQSSRAFSLYWRDR